MPIGEIAIIILSFLTILFCISILIVQSVNFWDLGYRFISVLNFIFIFLIISISFLAFSTLLN